MKSFFTFCALAYFCLFLSSTRANASPAPVIAANKTKQNAYLNDVTVYGGNANAPLMSVNSIRRAKNKGFERIVVDLNSPDSQNELPYFQVALASDQNKIILGIRGIQGNRLKQNVLNQRFARSAIIASSYLVPVNEDGLFSLELDLRKQASVETFYLTNPPRIILDIETK